MEYNGKLFMERLREVTENKTNQEISSIINVDPSTISRWKEKVPKTENLIQIANTFNCSIDYLLGINNTNTTQKPDLLDVIRDLFIYDMQKNINNIIFEEENKQELNVNYPVGIIKINGFDLQTLHLSIDYGDLFKKYSKIKEAFKLIDDNEIKIGMIDTLINQYKIPCF